MRVLFVDLESEWRGGQSQALLTMRGLRERGLDVELVAVRNSPLAIRSLELEIPVRAVPRLGLRPWGSAKIRGLLRQNSYEIVHVNEPHALTAAWLAGAHKEAAMVVSRRVAYPLKHGKFAIARYLAAQRILAISRFVKKSVVDSNVPEAMVDIVYEGVEVPAPVTLEARRAAREHWGVNEQETLFGCVGYLLPEKGQELAVRALVAVRAQFPRVRLLFAGDGPCRPQLEALSRQLGLKDAMIFAGFVEDVSRVYAALDAFVFPSLAEPLGTSLLAAMAWGLPVLAVASGGVPEYIENGETGLLVDQPDSGLLSAGVLRLLDDPEFAKRLGAAARAAIQDRFTAERMVESTIRAYEDVLRKRQKT